MNTSLRPPSLLLLDDQPDYLVTVGEVLEDAGYSVLPAQSASEARQMLDKEFVDLLVIDDRLGSSAYGTDLLAECRGRIPGLGGILVTGYADLETALRAMRAGALDLLQKPVEESALLRAVARALAQTELTREVRYNRWRAQAVGGFPGIIGSTAAMRKIFSLVPQVAATPATVLIEGESGTGKELIARAIHARSPRRNRPFLAVNMGALSPGLLESTLFGSKKGSYTDSKADQRGYFEAAHGGTIFLDEIGEASGEVQVRLLRVLQEKVITRVGETKEVPVDVRVMAATNRDLREEVRAKRFRSDLYFRLAVITIALPPLRERIEDIPALAQHFLSYHAQELGRTIRSIAPDALELLKRYPWPGNVRELDNVIQRAVILAERDEVTLEGLSLETASTQLRDLLELLDQPYRDAAKAFDQRYFARLLARFGGNKSKAADFAGIDRTVLYDHLNRYPKE